MSRVIVDLDITVLVLVEVEVVGGIVVLEVNYELKRDSMAIYQCWEYKMLIPAPTVPTFKDDMEVLYQKSAN